MLAILHLLGTSVASLFKSRRRLEVENLFLRHQLNVALRRAPRHLRLRGSDRALLVWMTWLWPRLLGLSRVVQPDTILRWHRAGLRAYWRLRSRARVLSLYSLYYNETRTHLGLAKDAPLRRAVQRSGTIVTTPILSGLHHRYARI